MVNHTSSLPLFKIMEIMRHLDLCMGSLFAPDKATPPLHTKRVTYHNPQGCTDLPCLQTTLIYVCLFSKIITNQIMLTLRVALELG